MFEARNFGQGPFYVIVWPLVTSDLDQSECFTSHCKTDTRGFYLSVHSSNSIKNWPFQVKLYMPYPKFCATFWKPTYNINHWISTLSPCCQWSERPPWFLWCPSDVALFRSSEKPPGTLWHANDPWLQDYISEVPRPIAAKLCHMIGIWLESPDKVQKFGGLSPTKYWGPSLGF